MGFALLGQLSAEELERVRYNNPNLAVNVGVRLWGWPLPLNCDRDGDLDLVVSTGGLPYEGTYFFENRSLPDSSSAMPQFLPGARIGEDRTNAQVFHSPGHPALIATLGESYPTSREDAYAKAVDVALSTERVYASSGNSSPRARGR